MENMQNGSLNGCRVTQSTEVPFMNSIPRVKVTNTTHEWQLVELSSAANNAVIEGDDATTDSGTATTRLSNLTQISDKVARVTGTARSVNTAGRDDEMDLQIMLKGMEHRRDMETALLDNQAKVTGNDTTARQLAGIGAWITTNTSKDGGGSDPTTPDGTDARGDGTQRDLTEAMVKTVVRAIFDEGGDPNMLMTGAFNRQNVSGFTGGNTVTQKSEDKTLHATFDVYESDFNQLKIVPNRFQRARDLFILETNKWALGFLPGREFAEFELAKTGDTDRKQVLSEYTLESRNQKASGGVFDLSTS